MVRHIGTVTLEKEHLSGQKRRGPRGLNCLSLSARPVCVRSWMQTLLLMTLLGRQTIPPCAPEFTSC